jgi:hypothetical protein
MDMEPVSGKFGRETAHSTLTGHDLFDVYSVAIEDTNELKNYGQRIDSMYVTILTLILAGDAYVAAGARFDTWVPVAATAGIGLVGLAFCLRWLRGLANLNQILNHRYQWLRDLEAEPELQRVGADLFTKEYEVVYEKKGLDAVARRRARQIQIIFLAIFIAIPAILALATFAATNPWIHFSIEPLFPSK